DPSHHSASDPGVAIDKNARRSLAFEPARRSRVDEGSFSRFDPVRGDFVRSIHSTRRGLGIIGASSRGDPGLPEHSIRKRRGFLFSLLFTIGMTSFSGCWSETKVPQPTIPTFPGLTLKVGALGDPALLTGVAAQSGEWKASRHGDVAIREQPLSIESVGD